MGGRKQRTLLAVLLLHANAVLPRGDLVDALWGERPPPSASDSLDTYVYRLRKQLGSDRLLREQGGYRLRVDHGELDVDRFEELVADARCAVDAGDHRDAGALLTAALGLWRGPAWTGQLDSPAVFADAYRLEERRLNALESRFEAALCTGGGAELVSELEQLVGQHPLRERLLAALMLALYRAGRQTDALEVFQTARRRLLDELGLELGPQLRELQQRILQHDRTLGAAAPVLGDVWSWQPAQVGERRATRARGRRDRRVPRRRGRGEPSADNPCRYERDRLRRRVVGSGLERDAAD